MVYTLLQRAAATPLSADQQTPSRQTSDGRSEYVCTANAEELADSQKRLAEEYVALEKATKEESDAKHDLDKMEEQCKRRKAPLESQWVAADTSKKLHSDAIRTLNDKIRMITHSDLLYDLGPASFHFVTNVPFEVVCNLVVTSNLIQLFLQMSGYCTSASSNEVFAGLDRVFLAWYIFELTCKLIYFRKNFFVGQLSVVWWNYLDFAIVASGVLDEIGSVLFHINASAVKLIRVLRIFRLLRILKLLRALLLSDLAWTEDPEFVKLMTFVIAVNAVVMGLELDYDWPYWFILENIFLVLYTFELSAKLKHWGCVFFTHSTDMVWNNLDFMIVCSAIIDQWLLPLISLRMKRGVTLGNFGMVIKFMRLMRLLRVLRLVSLLKRIKPLYMLIIGVLEAFEAMRWVMILTGLLLYACAILFTTLVGKGLIFSVDSDASDEQQAAQVFYGSVVSSLFSLFKMMNGDTEPLAPLAVDFVGQLLWVLFMVIANWAILAILTSVICDNMRASACREAEREKDEEVARIEAERQNRIYKLFMQLDIDASGSISGEEWERMLAQEHLRNELMDASGATSQFLHDLFTALCEAGDQPGKKKTTSLSMEAFCNHLRDETKVANQRSLMAVMAHIKLIDSKLELLLPDERDDALDPLERIEELNKIFARMDRHRKGVVSGEEWGAMLADEELRRQLEEASGLDKHLLEDFFASICQDGTSLSCQRFCESMKHESRVVNQRSFSAITTRMKALESKFDSLIQHFEADRTKRGALTEGKWTIQKDLMAMESVPRAIGDRKWDC